MELNAGRFTADSSMPSSSRDDVGLKSINVVGGAFNENLSASLYYADNEDVAKKKYANVNYVMPFSGEQALSFDFNIYRSDYDKDYVQFADADRDDDGNITQLADRESHDNTIWSLAAKYSVGAHAFILAHQRVSETAVTITTLAMAVSPSGSPTYYSDFNWKDERSWQASYELDFSSFGAPGLFWKTAYVYGDNIDTGAGEGKEREFFNQVQYVVQSGPVKDCRSSCATRSTAPTMRSAVQART